MSASDEARSGDPASARLGAPSAPRGDGAGARGRALERLRGDREREETIDSASGEHAENEALLASIRGMLLLAPSHPRARSSFEAALERAPFPLGERLRDDGERLEAEAAERLALVRRLAPSRFLVGMVSGAILLAAGAALAFAVSPAWAALAAGGAFLAGVFTLGLGIDRRRFLRAERERLRAEIEARLAADRERDRVEHERRDEERTASLRRLLDGEPERCREAFGAAAGRLDLPLRAAAELSMVSPERAEIALRLHLEEEIPAQRSTLLKSGRITYRNRPKRDVREEDARAIASLCLLHAAVAFDELPSLESLLLSAFRRGVDPATGRDADLCLASVWIERAALARLKLDRLDPVAALRSLEGRFACSAAFVLKPVEPLRAPAAGASPPVLGAPPSAGASGSVRRDNPDLDEIFG